MVNKPFIGKPLNVHASTNNSLVGLSGVIVDETKQSFRIQTDSGEEKIILKKGSDFFIENTFIPGNEITKRLEDRLKIRSSKRWKI